MEFWGVEVKAGQPLKVNPENGRVVHISQAALGERKKEKGNDFVMLRVKINGEQFVVGSLSGDKFPQVTFDLVFEKEFELTHDWKNGSVYFCGYSADNPYAEDEDEFGSEDLDEDDEMIPMAIPQNGKIEPKGEEAKPAVSKAKAAKPESSAKPKVSIAFPENADVSDDDDDDESDEDEDDSDKDMMNASDDISDSDDEDDSEDDDDSEDEDDETPKKAESSKKRPTASAIKTPVSAKKAKLDTPQKTDGKKGGVHTATPHPSKKAGKTPVSGNKSKEQTPKSDGKITCKSCTRTFTSENALDSHTKAKHTGK